MTILSRPFQFLVLLALVAGLSRSIAASEEKEAPPKPLRVLFVGNSQIYYNDLPRMLESLAESAPTDRARIRAEAAVAGGASLQSHWKRGEGKGTPRSRISDEKWDFVVLQEIYNAKPDSFATHARLFHDLIRKSGARTVLLSTGSVSQLYPKGFQELHAMHLALGKELNVPVAAAGNAWLAFWGDSSTPEQRLALYDPDKAHPGKKGSYIYACTLYAILTGQSPVGLTHRIPKQAEDTITPAEAKQFQEAAWLSLRALPPAASGQGPDKNGWFDLFDGKSLDGWKAADEPKAFKVEDGLIVAGGTKLTHLFYVGPVQNAKFKNFELKAEVKTRPKGNSGIIFHTEYQAKGFPDKGFEFQINNTGSDKVYRTGSIYPAKPMNRIVVKDDEWFECHLIVKEGKVVLKVNGEVTMEATLPYQAKTGRTLGSGTFAIQGHDPGSIVYFRSIRVKPME